jgi:sec-independent protein translocase protein TatB
MFGIGPTELIVILVVALLVLGPKRLPEIARALGKGLAEFRRATADVTSELDEARIALEREARDAARRSNEKKAGKAQPRLAPDDEGRKPTDEPKPSDDAESEGVSAGKKAAD